MHCDFFFFFSSRRRHTRLQGDWSSDVCSSDLLRHLQGGAGGPKGLPDRDRPDDGGRRRPCPEERVTAMITINLLAPGKRRAARLAPTGILPILGLGAVILVLVMFTIYLSDKAASTRAQLTAVNKQLEALGPVTQQVQKLEQT